MRAPEPPSPALRLSFQFVLPIHINFANLGAHCSATKPPVGPCVHAATYASPHRPDLIRPQFSSAFCPSPERGQLELGVAVTPPDSFAPRHPTVPCSLRARLFPRAHPITFCTHWHLPTCAGGMRGSVLLLRTSRRPPPPPAFVSFMHP